MKNRLLCIAALVLSLLLFPACSKGNRETPSPDQPRVLESSDVWTLGDRYPINYRTQKYIVSYDKNGEQFQMEVTQNKKETGMSKNVRESRNVGEIVFALCESKEKDPEGSAFYTYYECFTGSFRYFIGQNQYGFSVENVLSMDEAIALMAAPDAPPKGIKVLESEWNCVFRTDASNLQILIRPNDSGALMKSLSASFLQQTAGEDTYYISSSNDSIVYSNGTHSVQILQANRSGSESVDYLTLDECKAILALLG